MDDRGIESTVLGLMGMIAVRRNGRGWKESEKMSSEGETEGRDVEREKATRI